MATNEVYREGTRLSLPVPTGTKSGAPVRIGKLNAVALTDEGSQTATVTAGGVSLTVPSGGVSNAAGFASVKTSGTFNLPLTVTGTVAVGDQIYISGANALSNVATSNSLFGIALRAVGTAGAGKTFVQIINNGQ